MSEWLNLGGSYVRKSTVLAVGETTTNRSKVITGGLDFYSTRTPSELIADLEQS